ncbi:MAG: V-type ATP synthase subunit I [Thermoplasmata archaeon]|nr:MAG: V-type ATP synthase subunit I [Thermoplasmata archaeon]
MLRPQKMSRVLIAGVKTQLDRTIETLYNLNIVHIEDYRQDQEGFKLGKPLDRGSRISEELVTVRSLMKNLDIDKEVVKPEKPKKYGKRRISLEISRDILPLQKNVLAIVERMSALERRKTDRENVKQLLKQLAAFPVRLELYTGFKNLDTYVGTIKIDPRAGLNKITQEYELFLKPIERGEMLIALFAPKRHSKNIFEFLNSKGFSPIDVPIMKGTVNDQLNIVVNEIMDIENQLVTLRKHLNDYNEKYENSILAGEEYLANEVEKTDAPLRFASSKNAFTIEGWIPTSKLSMVKLHLSTAISQGLYIEVLEEKEFTQEEEKEPPIQLENPKGAKPYEYLIELFSLPSYKEFDPTMVLYIIFPLFFAFMIGDAGYGIALMILAVIMAKKFPSDEAKSIARIVFIGGIFSIVFGLFIFADAFGIPFHAHESGEVNWSDSLGISIPIYAAIHKLDPAGVVEMLVISIFAAFVHLGLGFIIGISNEIKHNKKHAVAYMGWFIVLLAFFMLLMNMGKNTGAGAWIGENILFNIHLSAQANFLGLPMDFPNASLGLLIVGIILLIVCEGPIAVMEVMGLVGNMISYTRLAAIGVAKGAVAVAFNILLLPMLLGGNVGLIIVGIILLFLCHMLVIILGALSAGIQAVRLNYVEFFLKFYKGGGERFKPFGAIKRYTI